MARSSTPLSDEHDPSLTIEKAFGIVLRRRRSALHLKLVDLEGDGLLDNSQISRLERGLSAPSLQTVFTLAEKLGCLPGDLLNEVYDLLQQSKQK